MESNSNRTKPVSIVLFVVVIAAVIFWNLNQLSRSPETRAAPPMQVAEPKSESPQVLHRSEAEPLPASETKNEVVETKLKILGDIMASHNDNDPRLDKDLRVLDRETKRAFRSQYEKIPVEQRNARGTIVFLLGRNLTEKEDFDFVRQVLQEEPCRSLENCARAPIKISQESPPSEMVLNYPQAVALSALGEVIASHASPPHVRSESIAAIHEGTKSQAPIVAKMSNELLEKLTQ